MPPPRVHAPLPLPEQCISQARLQVGGRHPFTGWQAGRSPCWGDGTRLPAQGWHGHLVPRGSGQASHWCLGSLWTPQGEIPSEQNPPLLGPTSPTHAQAVLGRMQALSFPGPPKAASLLNVHNRTLSGGCQCRACPGKLCRAAGSWCLLSSDTQAQSPSPAGQA